jgi:hypothetical protein
MGFKKTSELIAISFGIDESALNTFTEDEVALQLDILNNEVFVVLAADLNVKSPDMVSGTDSSSRGAVASTSFTVMPNLSNTNTIAVAQEAIRSDAPTNGVAFTREASESYAGNNLDYIAIIATNNFFVSCQGSGNLGAKGLDGRLWGYRARADASTYAALVQSEVLSA